MVILCVQGRFEFDGLKCISCSIKYSKKHAELNLVSSFGKISFSTSIRSTFRLQTTEVSSAFESSAIKLRSSYPSSSRKLFCVHRIADYVTNGISLEFVQRWHRLEVGLDYEMTPLRGRIKQCAHARCCCCISSRRYCICAGRQKVPPFTERLPTFELSFSWACLLPL